jgi:hypothetical protein
MSVSRIHLLHIKEVAREDVSMQAWTIMHYIMHYSGEMAALVTHCQDRCSSASCNPSCLIGGTFQVAIVEHQAAPTHQAADGEQ